MSKSSEAAEQVFRQFAWNLAGKLANVTAGPRRPMRPKPANRSAAKS